MEALEDKIIHLEGMDVKVQRLNPKYEDIECIESYKGKKVKDILIHRKFYKWNEFKKKYAKRIVLSIYNCDETETTVLNLERINIK